VRQVVWNLATNGLRAMPNGGALRLSARRTFVEGCQSGVLIVEDEGVGIAADEIERIFHPFNGSFGKGTGLGLAIVHRIISDYNGRIDVQSERGRGTTFSVTFPPIGASQPAPSHAGLGAAL
jgi:signal transduction histidine kinase